MIGKFSAAAFRRAWDDPSLSADDIGKAFGITRSAVLKRGKALDLPLRGHGTHRRKITDDALFRRLWLGRVSLEAIAGHFGCTTRVVNHKAAVLGLPQRRFKVNKAIASGASVADFIEDNVAAVYSLALAREGLATFVDMAGAEMLDFHRADRAASGW